MLFNSVIGAGGFLKNSVTPYGFQGNSTHVSHISTSISGTVNLGTAYLNREIWFIVVTMGGGGVTSNSISSCSVGSNSLTALHSTTNTTNPTTNNTGIHYFRHIDNGLLGTSTSYSVTFPNNHTHSGILIFTSPITGQTVDYKGAALYAALPENQILNTANGSWSISVTSSQNSSSGTLPNFANDGSFDYGTTEWCIYGYNTNPLASTTTVTSSTGASSLGENTITGLCRR